MSGLPVDASQPKPPLTPLMFVSIPSLTLLVFDRYPFWNFNGTELGLDIFVHRHSDAEIGVLHDTPPGEACTLLSCRPEVGRLATTILIIESLHGLAVSFLTAFYAIVNVEQQLAFRCLTGREQREQAFVVRIFDNGLQPRSPLSSLPSTSLALTQDHRSLFQHATAVVVPPLDESLLVAVSWQVCFFLTSCEPVRMRPVTFADTSH